MKFRPQKGWRPQPGRGVRNPCPTRSTPTFVFKIFYEVLMKTVILLILMAFISGCGERKRDVPEESNHLDFRIEKVFETSDQSGAFSFQHPDTSYYGNLIRVDARGDIYVRDYNRILKFDARGKFIKNLLQEGQGPGKVTRLDTFFVESGKLIVYDAASPKIILINTDGSFIKEFRFGKKSIEKFFAFHKGRYYFFDGRAVEIKNSEAKVIDVFHYLVEVTSKGEVNKIEENGFPVKTFVASQGGNSGSIDIGNLMVAPYNGSYFFVSHTAEYSLKLWDLDKKAVIKILKRPYERQEPPLEIAQNRNRQVFHLNDKLYRLPPRKYLDDICNLLVYRDKLWVLTSTVEGKKGVLIDVYDRDGDYNGKFYLKLSDRVTYLDYFSPVVFVYGDFLYSLERDAEDNPWLVKYRILEKP